MDSTETLVLVEKSGHCIAFHDLAGNGEAQRIRLGDFPHEVVVDHKGQLAFVGHYGVQRATDPGIGGHTVFVIDIARRQLVNMLDCRPYTRIHGLAVDEAGRLYALSEAADVLMVFDNPAESKFPSKAVVTGGLKGHLVLVKRDGSAAYVTNLLTHTVTKIAPHNPTIAPVSLMPGEQPEGSCFDADESALFVTNRRSNSVARIDTGDFVVELSRSVRADPTRIYRVGDDRLLVTHLNGRGVSLLDSTSLHELAFLPLEGRPAAACIGARRGTAHVSLDTNESLEISLEDLRVVTRLRTGAEPDACFISRS